MSQEWVDSVRNAYDAFSRGDFAAALQRAHPDIEFVPPAGEPHSGIDSVRAWMEPDAFDRQVVEPLEILVSGDKVLVRQLIRARGAGSGIELEVRSWAVWTIGEDGRVIRIEGFMEQQEAEAKRAAGLAE
jgi:ketosteroid isomerase-like protein